MKKAIGIALLAALIVSLSGCANTDYPQTIQDSSGIEIVANEIDERAEPEESSSASVLESGPGRIAAWSEGAQVRPEKGSAGERVKQFLGNQLEEVFAEYRTYLLLKGGQQNAAYFTERGLG